MNNSRLLPLLGNVQLESMVSGDELRFLQVGAFTYDFCAERGGVFKWKSDRLQPSGFMSLQDFL